MDSVQIDGPHSKQIPSHRVIRMTEWNLFFITNKIESILIQRLIMPPTLVIVITLSFIADHHNGTLTIRLLEVLKNCILN